jgi:5-oxoprolinase (ATP-hydrolysing)
MLWCSERKIRELVNKALPGIPVFISSEVLPELMEYERTITTVVNAYVAPRVSNYLQSLLETLDGRMEHLRVLRSDGGLSSVSLASRFPVTLALSGPAGGVAGVVSAITLHTKYKNLITVDMGGTSTDGASSLQY